MAEFQNVLHTHSGYAKRAINKNFLNYLESHKDMSSSLVERVKQKERELYNQFGVDTYDEFFVQIRRLFKSEDIPIIKRFEANTLSNDLKKFAIANSELLNQEVRFVFYFDKMPSLKLASGKEGIKIKEGAKSELEFTYNIDELKRGFNQIFSGRYYRGQSRTAINDLIKALIEGGALNIQVAESSSGGGKKYVDFQANSIPNYPWGLTKNDFELAEVLGDASKLHQDMVKAIQTIHDYIFYDLAAEASEELHRAMKVVWIRNFGTTTSFDAGRFFAGTTKDNFISKVQGSLGEFQAAVIFEYLKGLNASNQALSLIQGNIYRGGEQGKTDVQIFRSIGLQVKNVSTIMRDGRMSLIRDLETNIHPDKFAKYLDQQYQSTFLDFLANYFFNKDYQEAMLQRMQSLQNVLQYWLIEIMNMAMADASVDDTVSFYLIGGKYLVPCSVLIENAEELKLKENIDITSRYDALYDWEYRTAISEETGENLYLQYWQPLSGETGKRGGKKWKYTQENEKEYQNLIGSRISIRTHFNLFEKIQDYALW